MDKCPSHINFISYFLQIMTPEEVVASAPETVEETVEEVAVEEVAAEEEVAEEVTE